MMIKNICSMAVLAVLLPSCSARINGVLRSGGSAELDIRASLEGRTAALIGSLQRLAGGGSGDLILDGPALARSLAAAPGISSASFRNTGPAAIEGTVTISKIGEFLTPVENRERPFVTWQETGTGGAARISLDRQSAPRILRLIAPEVRDYLEALMAPAVTGEQLTKTAYLDLVSSIYGRTLADEISASRIQLSLEFPKPLSIIRGGKASGNRADFDIPLLDILVLDPPLDYETAW